MNDSTSATRIAAFSGMRATFVDWSVRSSVERMLRDLTPEPVAWQERLRSWGLESSASSLDVAEWAWMGLRVAFARYPFTGCVDGPSLPLGDAASGLVVSAGDDPGICHVRAGEFAFRVRAGVIRRFDLDVILPARGPGGYVLAFRLEDGQVRSESQLPPYAAVELPLQMSVFTTLGLLRSTMLLSSAFGARLRYSESGDV